MTNCTKKKTVIDRTAPTENAVVMFIECDDYKAENLLNDSPAGLVFYEATPDQGQRTICSYHGQLVSAGKAEHRILRTTRSLYVNKRIDPRQQPYPGQTPR